MAQVSAFDRSQRMTIIGIDCAAQPTNFGLACAHVERFGENCCLRVSEVVRGHGKDNDFSEIVAIIRGWIEEDSAPTLLALDAPLGWPCNLGKLLSDHQAGRPPLVNGRRVSGHDLFRRHTDRFVAEFARKTPMDVGANTIARVARSALELLSKIKSDGDAIPLAWNPETVKAGHVTVKAGHVHAIEVYPDLTLRQLFAAESGAPSSRMEWTGYKKPKGKEDRKKIVERLFRSHGIKPRIPPRTKQGNPDDPNGDCIDAVLCALEGLHFLMGKSVAPDHDLSTKFLDPPGPPAANALDIARHEGWIWFHQDLLPENR